MIEMVLLLLRIEFNGAYWQDVCGVLGVLNLDVLLSVRILKELLGLYTTILRLTLANDLT